MGTCFENCQEQYRTADAKSQSLGFSLSEVVSLAPPFTFYNHEILEFKPEGILRGHLVQCPGIMISVLKIETVLGCPPFALSVLPWYSKPSSSWVRCEVQVHTGGPASGGVEQDETLVLLGGAPWEQGWVSVISSPGPRPLP